MLHCINAYIGGNGMDKTPQNDIGMNMNEA